MSKTIRVLLVEDNPADVDLTRDTLESSKFHVDLTVVADGVEAVHYLRKRSPYTKADTPDLILLDLNLPRMGGREVLEDIRQEESLRRIPVVILTSSDAEKDIVRSYELGANCYITKPVGLESFQAIVRAVESFWFAVVKLP